MTQQKHARIEEHAQTEAGRAETVCASVLVSRVPASRLMYICIPHTHCHTDNMHAGAPVYSCNVTDVDSYCCYDNCKCENPFEVFSFDGTPANVSTMTVILESFTQTRNPTATAKPQNPSNLPATSFALPTGSPNGSANSSASAEVASSSTSSPNYLALGIGLGLGLGLGFPIIFLVAFFCWRRRKAAAKKSLQNSRQPPELNSAEYYPPAQKYAYNLDGMPKAPQ